MYLVKRKADNADMAVKTFDKKLLGSVEKAKVAIQHPNYAVFNTNYMYSGFSYQRNKHNEKT